MLWFSGPPINVVRTPSARHSSTYLYYLAMKRKRKQGNRNENGNENENEEEQERGRGVIDSIGGVTTAHGDELRPDGDGAVTSSAKRHKAQQEHVWPSVREMTSKLWVDMGMDN